MKSYSASAVRIGKSAFLKAIILAGIIFIGFNAASNPPAVESVTGQAPSGAVSDARGKVGQAGEPKKPMYSTKAYDSTTLPPAVRADGKNVGPAGSPKARPADMPGYILILLIIAVFGYVWVNADRLLSAPKSEKIRINLMPRSMNPEADGVFFIHRREEP